MAVATQVYTIINATNKQMMGQNAITVVDTKGLMSTGDAILKSDTDTDAWVHALSDLIGKTVFSVRAYESEHLNMVWHAFDYGLAMRKIYVDLPDTVANTAWQIGEESYEPEYAPRIQPNVKQHLFKNLTTFEIDISIPDDILRTAFRSEIQMASLISAIFMAIDNRVQLAIEACGELLRAAFAARKLLKGDYCGSINLFTRYKAAFPSTTITADTALYDSNFLRWSASQIKLWTRRMRKMSTLFNNEGYKRHTPQSELVLILLDEYDSNLTTYLEADTYHKELVAIPNFSTVSYWQGSGTKFQFSDTSKISVKLEENGTTVTQGGIIAVAYDYQALGMMIDRRKITTERNAKAEYTNYYNKVTRSYFNDMSENGIVFYISTTDFAPPTPPTPETQSLIYQQENY